MSHSGALRVRDFRDAHQLIGECRELGADPALWHRHAFEGLSRLLGAMQVSGGEGWRRGQAGIEAVSAHQVSADGTARAYLLAYYQANGQASDPILAALAALPGPQITRTRRQLVPDAVWYRSVSFDQYRRPAAIDHELASICQVSDDGAISAISLNRISGEPDFSTRERLLVELFHAELGRLIGGPLVSAIEPGLEQLPPRLRQTLACLMEGDSEKQVAARLGLAQPTVHQYATRLYRRFRVRSRAQLLVHGMRRIGNESWGGLLLPAEESSANAAEPDPEALSPRLRQTLACLMEGDSEKQAAARLGLSRPTVHQYVTTLYRIFGVGSRPQLLAHVMRRFQAASWGVVPPLG
jgi:DNA-binding CsgD family transcriptional regulator